MRIEFPLLTILILTIPMLGIAQEKSQQREAFVFETNLPDDIQELYKQEKIKGIYSIRADLNPFYIRGDFDGDKKQDYALSIIERKTGKKGILIYHSGTRTYYIVGAGKLFNDRHPGDDFSWMDAWKISMNKNVEIGVGETKKIIPKGEMILAIKTESSSGLIYWTGKEYRWYQQGD